MHYPVFKILAMPHCCFQVLYPAGTFGDLFYFFWRGSIFSEETQTAIILGSCKKGAKFFTSSIQLALSTHLLNHLACSSTPCGPALLSLVPQRDQAAVQIWHFQSMYYWKALVWESDQRVLHCVATLWGNHYYSPWKLSLCHCHCHTGRLIWPAFVIGHYHGGIREGVGGRTFEVHLFQSLLTPTVAGLRDWLLIRRRKNACPNTAILASFILNEYSWCVLLSY